jgi:GH15 family glucan-1,4-alpha-glucosidase
MTTPTTPGTSAQRSLLGSPFTPIEDYAFLSDCHTGALVAPDGAVDWLCVPAFDAPSVFGSLMDREAGLFKPAPFGLSRSRPGTCGLMSRAGASPSSP